MKIAQLKEFIRHKYAWPGGYPMFAVTAQADALCHSCCELHAKDAIRNTRCAVNQADAQWRIVAVDVNWENTDMYCTECNKPIESAYGEEE